MIGQGPGGAVAAGSPFSVQAGLHALAMGGNAVDAAVAAQLMACVAEPLLTGLGGGGLATFKVDGEVGVCDFFSDVPGLGRSGPPPGPMREITVDYGPTTQVYAAGPAAVAVPGMPKGLMALHGRFGRVAFAELARPAARMAREGVPVLAGFERVAELLWPILSATEGTRALLGRGDGPLKRGDTFRCPALGETIERFAAEGEGFFVEGEAGRALVAALGSEGWLTLDDLRAFTPAWRPALCLSRGGARVWVPGPPSQGGALTLKALLALDAGGPLPAPLSAAHVLRIARAMEVAEETRPEDWPHQLQQPGFVPRYLSAGFTTHISTVDGEGNAVGLTSSLGETAGLVLPGLGLLPNNFLGETDVNPPGFPRPPGDRLMTMMCPTLLELPEGRVLAMGSGGSSRIRSALLHGVLYLGEHGLDPYDAVRAPRAHFEGGELKVETADREPAEVALLKATVPDLVAFDAPGMYFGGLHVAGVGPQGFSGAGDPRRSGAFGSYR